MQTDVLVVGGGLSGLSLAHHLAQTGTDFLLVEAQDRLGGRILTQETGGAAFDLGPAWFWPGQLRMAQLVRRLGLEVFEQYSTGAIVFQDPLGHVQRDRGYSSMMGSLRVAGGMGALISGLQSGLAPSRLRLKTKVTSIEDTGNSICAKLESDAGVQTVTSRHVVLAVPPRIIADTITFTPELPQIAMRSMTQIPTWMAAQAKIVAIYDHPHWRNAGLSGDATSQKGPMVELHDASPAYGGPYALFGFVGYPAAMRAEHPDEILDLARQQLVAMFGPEMANPIFLHMQDWALNPAIATAADQVSPRSHPNYGLPSLLSNLWSGTLTLASTEVAQAFGGYMEGALEAAEAAGRRVQIRKAASIRRL